MRHHKIHMRPEYRLQGRQWFGFTSVFVGSSFELGQECLGSPVHNGQPNGFLAGKVPEHGALREPNRLRQIACGDICRTTLSGQLQRRFHKTGLA